MKGWILVYDKETMQNLRIFVDKCRLLEGDGF